MPHTLAEKILLDHCDAPDVKPGDIVLVRCDLVLANDVSGPVAFTATDRMGAKTVFDPDKIVMVADHFMPAKDVRSAELQKRLREWSHHHGVHFFDQGRGRIEEGFVVPAIALRVRLDQGPGDGPPHRFWTTVGLMIPQLIIVEPRPFLAISQVSPPVALFDLRLSRKMKELPARGLPLFPRCQTSLDDADGCGVPSRTGRTASRP